MTREKFLDGLCAGLRGLPQSEIDDIVSDYAAHFADAMEAGRSEVEIAASLGDPAHLANELGAEAKLQRWETSRNPRNFLRAGAAVIGLQAFNLFSLLPVLAFLIFCAGIAAYVLYLVGGTGLHLMAGLLSGGGQCRDPGADRRRHDLRRGGCGGAAGAAAGCGPAAVGALCAAQLPPAQAIRRR